MALEEAYSNSSNEVVLAPGHAPLWLCHMMLQAESHLEGVRELAKKKSQQSWSSWVGGWVYGGQEEEQAKVSKDISGGWLQGVVRVFVCIYCCCCCCCRFVMVYC